MRPYDVTNTEQFINMESDNHGERGEWSILHNGDHVSLHGPNGGRWVNIPRDQFNSIVDWYMAEQKINVNAE